MLLLSELILFFSLGLWNIFWLHGLLIVLIISYILSKLLTIAWIYISVLFGRTSCKFVLSTTSKPSLTSGSRISQRGFANPRGVRQPIIWQILAENSMKMKEIRPRGRRYDVWDVKSTSSKSHIKAQSVEEINSAAMLAAKRSVGVTPEMNLREHVTCMPSPMLIRLPTLALKPRGDVTRDISGPTKRTFVLQKL